LYATKGIEHFLFWEVCSGALASFETACCDPRVLGVILINFQTADSENEEVSPDLPLAMWPHTTGNTRCLIRRAGAIADGETELRQVIRVYGLS